MEKLISNLHALSSSQLDEILDKRDSNSFDSAWCELNDTVPITSVPFDLKAIFIKLSDASIQHEVCFYIADDLELMHRAEQAGIETDFLNALKMSYEQGIVPDEWHS